MKKIYSGWKIRLGIKSKYGRHSDFGDMWAYLPLPLCRKCIQEIKDFLTTDGKW